MKSFSYTNVTRTKYYAVRRWLRVSICLSVSTIFIMGLWYLPEYFLHQELAQQHTQLHSLALQNGKQATNTPTIQVALSKIEKRHKKASCAVTLLKKIKNLCNDESSLESLNLKSHDVQIVLAAKNAPTLVTFADNLAQQSSYSNLYISSLEPKEQRMIAVLKSHHEIKNS